MKAKFTYKAHKKVQFRNIHVFKLGYLCNKHISCSPSKQNLTRGPVHHQENSHTESSPTIKQIAASFCSIPLNKTSSTIKNSSTETFTNKKSNIKV